MIQRRTIRSLSELVDAVREFSAQTGHLLWYRGQASASWTLLPRVRRGYLTQDERNLSIQFFTRAITRHAHCPNYDDFPGWLSLMQHYGLPTRLLDWTRSPIVAAFFAVFDQNGQFRQPHQAGAAIWVLDAQQLNACQGFESYLYPMSYGTPHQYIESAFRELPNVPQRTIAVLPLESDARMTVQQGAFTVHATDAPLDLIQGAEQWLRVAVIPAEATPVIADELNLLGVRLSDLFPDLQHLAIDLCLAYPPRG